MPINFIWSIIPSNPLSVISNNALIASLSSADAFICACWASPHSPVCFLTSSMLVLIVSSCSISCIPASAPLRPKTSLRTKPTCWLSAPNSFILVLTSCITSKVLRAPVVKSFCTCFTSIPMCPNASLVLSLISRIFFEAIVMTSSPLSLKIPLRVCCKIATISDAPMPASWKVGA